MEDPFQVVKDEVQKTINMAIGLYYHWCELSNNTVSASKEEFDWTTNELKNCLRSIDWDLEDLDETIVIVERYARRFKIPPSEIQERRAFIHRTRQSVKEIREHLLNPGLKTLETTALLQESQVIDCLTNLNNNNNSNNLNNNMIATNQSQCHNNNNNNKIFVHNNNNNLSPNNNNNNNSIFTINNNNNNPNNTITIPSLSIKPPNNHYTRLNNDDDDDEEEDEEDDGVGGDDLPTSPLAHCLCLKMDEGTEETTNQPSSPHHDEHAIMLGQHRNMYPTSSSLHHPPTTLHRSLLKFQQCLGLDGAAWKKWALVASFIIIIITILTIFLLV